MKNKRIEVNEKYKGYEYLVYATPMGHRCGYVKIPKKHYLYGKSYYEQLNIKFSEIAKQPTGKRNFITFLCNSNLKPEDNISMDLLFDVHGGITFSGKGTSAEFNKRGWWIGFDCAHSEDKPDYKLMDTEYKKFYKYFEASHGEIRSREYVEQECKNLIDQIIKYFG